MEHFVAIFFRCSLLSNITKYSKSSPMMCSFQENAYIEPITQKHLNVQPQKLFHWNQHIQKPTCMEYQAILSISSWSKQSLFFLCISYLVAIFVPEKYTKLFLTRKNCMKSLEKPCLLVFGHADCNGGG